MPVMSIDDRVALAIGRLVIASETKSIQIEQLTERVKTLEAAQNDGSQPKSD